ncbi:MAG: AraC family transcriptional regulator [Saccharospirillaceae bacterium]|nr:AraC family transcriptional regulator [Saccharospirillaceae bacterium]
MSHGYINTSFLTGFSDLAVSRGGNPTALYEAVGLDRDSYIDEKFSTSATSHPRLLITQEQFVELLEYSARQLNCPDLALQLAKRQGAYILTPLVPMFADCQTLLDVTKVLEKYMSHIVYGGQIDVTVGENHIHTCVRAVHPHLLRYTQIEDYVLAVVYNTINHLLGKNYPLRACYFTRHESDPTKIEQYAQYFGCPVVFNNSELAITSNNALMDQSVTEIISQFINRVKRSIPKHHSGFIHQIRQTISLSLANNGAPIEDIARVLNMGHRTLQRRLHEQKISYRTLVDSVRHELANQYLRQSGYSLTDIAGLLGYSNLSSFSRGYQRYCGLSPTQARQQFLLLSGESSSWKSKKT